MLAEWDYDANNAAGLHPASVRPRSHKKAHWVCAQGHRWEASINNRVGHGQGCPYCAGQRVMPEDSLAALRPELLEEWDYEGKPGGRARSRFCCRRGRARRRTGGALMAIAGRRRSIIAVGSGQMAAPSARADERQRILPLLRFTRSCSPIGDYPANGNAGLDPTQLRPRSGKKAHWKCAEGHRWEAVIGSRTGNGTGCPVCNRGWTLEGLKRFVEDLQGVALEELSPAERYVIFQQTGALASSHAKLVDQLVRRGRLPQSREELEEIAAAVTAAEQGLTSGDRREGDDLDEHRLSEEQLKGRLGRGGGARSGAERASATRRTIGCLA